MARPERPESQHLPLALAVFAVLAATWLFWALASNVTVVEASLQGRVETDAALHPVASPFLGRVATANLHAGDEVGAGQVLLEIDSTPDLMQLRQEQAREQGLNPRLKPLQAQLAAEEAARAEEGRSAALAAIEARELQREAEVAERAAADETARQRQLFAAGMTARREVDRAESDLQARAAATARLRTATERVQQEQRARDRERDARLERLRGELAALSAERMTAQAAVQRLQHDVQRRSIRAPAAGRIAEAADVRPGMVVTEGERLASIIGPGPLRIVAQFAPAAALGRIKPGHEATLRVLALPWAQFGTVAARVARVANEPRGGTIRVDLDLLPSPGFRGRLEHGMPVSVEVLVDRISPLELALGVAGQWLTRQR